ncbi:NAD(P)H-binding protein [Brevundimonas sp. PAMC22021]|uniref:NmrA family NAD(P)-binding protein n=1 Tax=Brevundimonas sp. PAMC22021 TaxID=2861285 RepID=UPI001C63AE5F|nr:NAD(P)H-binding protein [Brevundimonas sp. PAMC22021]QYF87553.1 NAD(P)H-binding protein [Brevundimonas sp. PAMC22021]
MFIILGGTGHVGGAAARRLKASGHAVTVVTSDAAKVGGLEAQGFGAAVVDVCDVEGLRAVLRTGRRALLLNPPAPVSGDTDAQETATANAIVEAVKGAGLEKAVAASTYGARPGDACGDLTVLYAFEQALLAQDTPVAINRAAYYFSNFDMLLHAVRESGVLPTPFPAELPLPMAAPEDLGAAAARRLVSGLDDVGVRHVAGPERRTMADVARAFATALDRPVRVETIPRDAWLADYRAHGFSKAAAQSYARMTQATIDEVEQAPEPDERGDVTLESYIQALVARGG